MDNVLRILGAIVLIAAIILAVAALYAFPVKWLWNWLMPSLFRLRSINVYEAWGLCALAGLLFKNSSSNQKRDS